MGNKEKKLVNKFYSKDASHEWERLVKDPFHKLELETTLKFLKKYLPKKGLILDIGGGPGRYTIELAKRGYEVVLMDFIKENVDLAKEKIDEAKVESKVKGIFQGTVTNLSKFKDNSFDGVICLGGVLSHVHPENERKKAISELIRVSKPNAPIFISVIGMIGTLTKFRRWIDEVADKRTFKGLYEKGEDYQFKGIGYAHFFRLSELKRILPNRFKFLEEVGLEGIASVDEEHFNEMAMNNKQALKNWLEMHDKMCTDPNVVDLSSHFMVIGKKAH